MAQKVAGPNSLFLISIKALALFSDAKHRGSRSVFTLGTLAIVYTYTCTGKAYYRSI